MLSGKVAIITGGASGIGAATAQIFVQRGARVAITDVADGAELAGKLGANAIYLHHDVSRADQWASIVERTVATFGPVNILVNNAGIDAAIDETGQSSRNRSIDQIAESQFRRIIEINQLSVFFGTKAILETMKLAGNGSIINVSSVAGLVGLPNLAAYNASKFAVTGLTKAAALDYGVHGIRVNSVHPGIIETPMLLSSLKNGIDELAPLLAMLPFKFVGKPADVGEMIAFLASDATRFCTGASYMVDGGWCAQ